MLAPVIHILGLTNIRRTRLLPVNGKVGVRVGQRVNATDVIATARVPSRHILVDVRRGLGVTRTDEADRAIIRQEGEKLQAGDVIAESGGLFARIIRAPENGTVVMISGGRVVLEAEASSLDLRAGIPGVVTEIHPDQGATIETNGALIQGAWGNNLISEGLLFVLIKSPEDMLTQADMDVSLRGAVVAAGHCNQADVLRFGNDLPLRGLILSSMTADLIPVANSVSYPIIVLEGFGKIPLDDAAMRLLATSEKRDVSMNAGFNPSTGEKAEVVIPLPADGGSPPEMTYFSPEQTVRIQGHPYRGKTGTIVQIRPGTTILQNGLRAPAADVRLDKDTVVIIPLANLEVIL
jgi:hypothetical protein